MKVNSYFRLLAVQKNLEEEIVERKAGDKELNQKIDDVNFELNEKLDKETLERNSKMKEFEKQFNDELSRQRVFTEDLNEKVPKFVYKLGYH